MPRHNLPPQPNAFIGRAAEVQALTNLLHHPATRLITLLGPGGTGKTRLSLHLAHLQYELYTDGVCFIELEPITDPDLVVPTVARTLAVPESAGTAIADALRDYLHDKHMLLIFDNMEQVIAAAPHIAAILDAAPHVQAITSSREALRVSGEQIYLVQPLPVPDPAALPPLAELAHNPAVAVFVQRAQFVKPDFVLTAENAPAIVAICARLDGLPLAIELAASRVRQFPPEKMLVALMNNLDVLTKGGRDKSARQQTLRGLIEWSYSLLSIAEQMVFGRLAVFADGFTCEAAEQICNIDDDLPVAVADCLAALAEKNLLRIVPVGDGFRFTMLNTIHDFAGHVLTRLAPLGEAALIRQRHAAYYLSLVQQAEVGLWGADQAHWLACLSRDYANIDTALTWAVAEPSPTFGMQLVCALYPYWEKRGYYSQARHWADAFLALPQIGTAEQPHYWRSRVVHVAGMFSWRLGDFERAVDLYTEALAAFRALGDDFRIAQILRNLGSIARDQGEYARAEPLLAEALAIHRARNDAHDVASTLTNIGLNFLILGRYAAAIASFDEALSIDRLLADSAGIASDLLNLAWIALAQRDVVPALAYVKEALICYQSLDERDAGAECLVALGCGAALHGQDVRAVRLWAAASQAREELGMRMGEEVRFVYDPVVMAVRTRMAAEVWDTAWTEGTSLTWDRAINYALAPDAC